MAQFQLIRPAMFHTQLDVHVYMLLDISVQAVRALLVHDLAMG